MNRINYLLLTLVATLFLIGCSSEESNLEIINPANYVFERDGISTVSFSGQTTRIGMATELINKMQEFSATETELLEMYSNKTRTGDDADPFEDANLNESTKSLKSKVASSRDFFSSNTVESAEIKADFESWILAQVSEVFPSQNKLASAGSAGQIADGTSVRYINAKGLEYNQAVNKSLIGALMVDQICNNYLSTAVLDEADNRSNNDSDIVAEGKPYTTMEHKWDEAYGYLFGAAGTSEDNPLSTLGNDDFLNKYLAKVDSDIDFSGIANDIYQAFKLGRAAIVAKNYKVRDEQADIIKEKISEVIGARAIYYLQQGKLAKENGNMGRAFHNLSEGFGFVYSLRFLRKPDSSDSYFTKYEVENFLNQLTVGNGFWDISSQTLDQISSEIANKFNFTQEQAAG